MPLPGNSGCARVDVGLDASARERDGSMVLAVGCSVDQHAYTVGTGRGRDGESRVAARAVCGGGAGGPRSAFLRSRRSMHTASGPVSAVCGSRTRDRDKPVVIRYSTDHPHTSHNVNKRQSHTFNLHVPLVPGPRRFAPRRFITKTANLRSTFAFALHRPRSARHSLAMQHKVHALPAVTVRSQRDPRHARSQHPLRPASLPWIDFASHATRADGSAGSPRQPYGQQRAIISSQARRGSKRRQQRALISFRS